MSAKKPRPEGDPVRNSRARTQAGSAEMLFGVLAAAAADERASKRRIKRTTHNQSGKKNGH